MKKEFLSLMSVFILGISVYLFLPIKEDNVEKIYNSETNNQEIEKESVNNDIVLSFDIIRITRNGDAVLAGRSLPGIKLWLYNKKKKLAEISSDANGEWVWTSGEALESGPKEFSLKYIDQKGKEYVSKESIIVFIEKNRVNEPFILKSDQDGDTNSLVLNLDQTIEDLSLDIVEYSPKGNLMLSGRAKLNYEISLFLDDKYIGNIKPNEKGIWTFISNDVYKYEQANLRLEIYNQNKILEKSFVTNIFNENLLYLGEKSLVVQPGNSLWRISRKTWGGGMLYTEIYKRNIKIINNPDLIYPGQVLTIPIISEKFVKE